MLEKIQAKGQDVASATTSPFCKTSTPEEPHSVSPGYGSLWKLPEPREVDEMDGVDEDIKRELFATSVPPH